MQPIDPIFYPVLAMLLLTAIISLLMTVLRAKVIMGNMDKINEIATRPGMAPHITGSARCASDNFNNLLEQPIMFYVTCLMVAMLSITDSWYVGLAWGYVALRIVHSIIHCAYNNMAHRGIAFGLASVLWLVMLGRLGVEFI